MTRWHVAAAGLTLAGWSALLWATFRARRDRARAQDELRRCGEDLRRALSQDPPGSGPDWRLIKQIEKGLTLGKLMGGIVHEISNPLSVIIGFAQSLSRGLGEGHAYFHPIKTIEREALRCQRVVQDVLSFSRTEGPGTCPCDLNAVVRSVLSLIEAQARSRSVEVVRTLADGLPMILANPNRIQQVLVNLSLNALEAMAAGGTLTILTLKVRSGKAQFVELWVNDMGQGIPDGIQGRIFEPYFTTKEAGKGTGLGLALVEEIVKEHGGTIRFESRLKEGTSFRIRFPAQRSG